MGFIVINLSSILNCILFSNFFSYPSQLHSISASQMASHPQCFFYILTLIAILPALCSSQEDFTSSRATYYGSPDCLGTPRGACGYGDFGRSINGGDVGAVAKLYKGGSGCGGCFQVRCTHPKLCSSDGVKIVVTDHGEGDGTDFILSPGAYVKLAAQPSMAAELIAHGVIDIEYKRTLCQYPGYNLMFKVHEHSKYPDYLAIVVLYQAGQKDVTAIELWQEDYKEWRGMRRAYGAVWDMVNPPKGDLNLRFQLDGNGEQKWVQLSSVIPSEWKAGVAYDSTMQLS